MNRLSWDTYFMEIADLAAQRSTCDRAFVGCVLVQDRRIIATGYNGSVAGQPHCDDDGHLMVDGHCVRTVHAEINALLQCAKNGVGTEGATAYVTHFPCLSCTKALLQAGVARIVYRNAYRIDSNARDLIWNSNTALESVESVKDLT